MCRHEVEAALKSTSKSPDQMKQLRALDSQLQAQMSALNLMATDAKTLAKQRSKEIVAKCLHKIGIVVPYDKKTDVGYRPLPKTDSELFPTAL